MLVLAKNEGPGAEVDVAIVGAGPFGLSLAAHLQPRGVSYRIFGRPMQAWTEQMPKGMMLKSDGFSSNLYDPDNKLTWKNYCAKHNIEYGDHGVPIHLHDFAAYGLEFQKTIVPGVEELMVVNIAKTPHGFALTLEDGAVARSAQCCRSRWGELLRVQTPGVK